MAVVLPIGATIALEAFISKDMVCHQDGNSLPDSDEANDFAEILCERRDVTSRQVAAHGNAGVIEAVLDEDIGRVSEGIEDVGFLSQGYCVR